MSYKTANELEELFTQLMEKREEFEALIDALEGSDNEDLTEDQNAEYAEIETALDSIRPAIRIIEETSEEAYDAACECFGEEYAVNAIDQGCYFGKYTDPLDLARELFDNNYSPDRDIRPYIDYQEYFNDLVADGSIVGHNGHYFYGNF